MAKNVCATCGALKKAGMITKEGLQFCDMQCHKEHKAKNKKKAVCEFC